MSEPSKPSESRAGFEPAAAAAIFLWVVIAAGLVYGISQTLTKVVELFN